MAEKSTKDQERSLKLLNAVRKTAAEVVEERFRKLNESGETARMQAAMTLGVDPASRQKAVSKTDHALGKALVTMSAAIEEHGEKPSGEQVKGMADKLYPGDPYLEKSLVAGEYADGGVFITGGVAQDFIDLLVPRVAVLGLQPVSTPMPTGIYKVPKTTADVSATYIGEVQEPTISKPSSGTVQLTAKKLAAIVPLSNTLLRRNAASQMAPNVDRWAERLAVRRMTLTMDSKLTRATGTEHTPKGLRHWADPSNFIPAPGGASPTLAAVLAYLGDLIEAMEGKDVAMTRAGHLFSTRTKNWMMFQCLTPTTTMPFFLEEMSRGTLLGFPFRASNQIPNNLGAGFDESEHIFADMDEVLLGETLTMQITRSTEAAYHQSGSVVSAFERGETLIRLEMEHDLAVEHEEGVAVGTGLQMGS